MRKKGQPCDGCPFVLLLTVYSYRSGAAGLTPA